MRRREFIAGLGGVAVLPPGAHAQSKLPTIGFLGSTTRAVGNQWLDAFAERLRTLGWVEKRTVAIEVRWAEGRHERFAEIAAEFVHLGVDVIVTHNTSPVVAAKKVTSVIPIVFATAGDPVGSGIVASLARPGGNVTGLSSLGTDSASKRLELLREVVPSIRRLAILANGSSPYSLLEESEVRAAARKLDLQVETFDVRRTEDFAPAIESLKPLTDALYVVLDPLMITNRVRINNLALGARVATMHTVREQIEAGGLMSYGPRWSDQFRRAADLVDKILRGAKPADLPVEQPTTFDLTINLITARALKLTVPPSVLARADEVIE